MSRSAADNEAKASTPELALESLKRSLKFEEWPLREEDFVPGFSPSVSQLPQLAKFELAHETLLPVVSTWVGHSYFYRELESRSAFSLTVIVGQQKVREVAEALLLQIVYSQMGSEPRVEFNSKVGEVAIYKQDGAHASIAFLRNNIGINLENYSTGGKEFSLEQLALSLDNVLQESPKVRSLSDDLNSPKIIRFVPGVSKIGPGDRADLQIEIRDEHPPLHYLFNAKMGSYNQDLTSKDPWYFRAGPKSGKAEVFLTVVNEINLMAQARCEISIE